jgi:hypothetical protein
MPVSSIGPASGLQDVLDVRPHVLRGDKFAPVGRRDAALYRLGETRIVVEKARDGFLNQFIDVASVKGRDCGKPGFLIGTEASVPPFVGPSMADRPSAPTAMRAERVMMMGLGAAMRGSDV